MEAREQVKQETILGRITGHKIEGSPEQSRVTKSKTEKALNRLGPLGAYEEHTTQHTAKILFSALVESVATQGVVHTQMSTVNYDTLEVVQNKFIRRFAKIGLRVSGIALRGMMARKGSNREAGPGAEEKLRTAAVTGKDPDTLGLCAENLVTWKRLGRPEYT
jgi:hypothetical protein